MIGQDFSCYIALKNRISLNQNLWVHAQSSCEQKVLCMNLPIVNVRLGFYTVCTRITYFSTIFFVSTLLKPQFLSPFQVLIEWSQLLAQIGGSKILMPALQVKV